MSCENKQKRLREENVNDNNVTNNNITYNNDIKGILEVTLWKQVDKFKMSSGYRNELSFNGFKIDILKSGLQKYIRRNILDKALWCSIELDLFAYCPLYCGINNGVVKDESIVKDENVVTRSEAIRTNLLNRLRIIYLEDIGIANVNLLNILDKWFILLFEYQDKRKNGKFDLETWSQIRKNEMCMILKIVDLLCKSKKSRSLSHYKSVFMNNVDVHQRKIMIENPTLFDNVKNTKYTFPFKYQLFGTEQQFEKLVNNFIESLHQKHDLAFYWANQILTLFKATEKRNGSLKSEVIIFDILLWFIKKKFPTNMCILLTKNVNILVSWYKNPRLKFKEISLTIIYAIALVLNFDIIDFNTTTYEKDYIDFDKLYEINLSGTKIEFDNFVIDIHTQKGRANKKTKMDFAQEGAYVENEDLTIVSQLYKQIYVATKKWDIPKEIAISSTPTKKESPDNDLKTTNIMNLITKYSKTNNTNTSNNTNTTITTNTINTPNTTTNMIKVTTTPLKLPDLVYEGRFITPILLKNIISWPTAQKLTASWKKVTYMGSEFVAKGPFDIRKITEKDRLLRVNRRQICNIATNTPNLPYFFVKEQNCLTNVWIISRQLAKTEPKKWKSNDRSSCGVSRVIDLSPEIWVKDERLILILFKNMLLNILTMQGDSGMHNQLIVPSSKMDILSESKIDILSDDNIGFNGNILTNTLNNNVEKDEKQNYTFVQIDTEDLRMTQPLSTTNDWKELTFIKNPKKDVITSIEKGLIKFNTSIVNELQRMMIIIEQNRDSWGITSNGFACSKRFIELLQQPK